MKFEWVSLPALLLLHEESIRIHGGSPGIRDEGLLQSAFMRPQNRYAYEQPNLFELAAAYGYGIAQNHPFVDGNKRAAFLAIGLFLAINGFTLSATQLAATTTMLALAAGELTEAELAQWLREHSQPSG